MSLVPVKDYTSAAEIVAARRALQAKFYPVSPVVRPEPASLAPRAIPQQPPARSGMLWSKEEVCRLREFAGAGASKTEAARLLGRSVLSVADYAGKIGVRFKGVTLQQVKSLAKEAVDCRLVYERLPPQVKSYERGRHIIAQVSADLGVTVPDMISDGRLEPVMLARRQAMWLIARDTQMSLPAIGKLFNRDHTTVLHAIRRENDRRGENVRNVGGVRRR